MFMSKRRLTRNGQQGCPFLKSDGFLQVLLKRQVLSRDLSRNINADIPNMPRLVRITGKLFLTLAITNNEAVFMGVGFQPLAFLRAAEALLQCISNRGAGDVHA